MSQDDRILIEKKIGDLYRWEPIGLANPRHLTPIEKLAKERKDEVTTDKAESRQTECWSYGCKNNATTWVREVGFDFKGDRAEPVQHMTISSADYPGPIPGFCRTCKATGPERLAETVYWDRPEMQWGVKPDRFFVIFTDGMVTGGQCIKLDSHSLQPKVTEEHLATP